MTKRLNQVLKYGVVATGLLIPLLPENLLSGLVIGLIVLFLLNRRSISYQVPAVNKFGLGFSMFGLVLIYGLVFSVSPMHSLEGFVRYMSAFLLMIMVSFVLEKKKDIFLFIQLLVGSTTLVAGYGIIQYLLGKSSTDVLLDKALHPDIQTRITSIMQNPNNLANFLVLIIPILFGIFMYKKHWFHKLIALAMLAIMGVALVLTYSRSGYVGLLVSTGIFVLFTMARLLILAPILGVAAYGVMPKGLESRVASLIDSVAQFVGDPTRIMDTSVSYRIHIWDGVFKMIRDFWPFGVGLGKDVFAMVYGFYSEYSIIAVHAHNVFLEILAEVGIVGFVVIIGFIVYVCVACLKMAKNSTNSFIRFFTVAIAAGVLGLLITGLAEYVWHYYKVFYAFFALLGVLMALYNNEMMNRTKLEKKK